MQGVEAVRRKGGVWWFANNEVHSAAVKGPFPNGDRFAVIFDYDVTPKTGPMAGKHIQMEEVALYTVGRPDRPRGVLLLDGTNALIGGRGS